MLIPDFTPLLIQSRYKNEKAETYLPSGGTSLFISTNATA
ncbi:hypothetical protein HMPREF1990_00765 [Porphyromonas gingivalis W4087]|uniref:Uncharacterized protein n=1 Tax=Porphyromonas gingivalis F0570 TaxID=1227271 RepID=A0A0E2LRV5_PORGN|nr:hypothetical protein HMPREF1555_00785 [Porphyromonas gingivalis F0570]ERJ89842.1 hypothetical protein HMPREF1990_00765 [Porphyromonas gingivalis W4087]